MNIGVIGGGSLGLLLMSYLSVNHPVTLYVKRKQQLNEIREKGISLSRHSDFIHNVKVKVKLITNLQDHDLIFVTVKQTHIVDVMSDLQSISEKTKVVFLQNGMGHIKEISHLRAPVYVGIVEHGANRISDYEVDHLGIGTIKLASLYDEIDELTSVSEIIHKESFPFEIANDWEKLLQSKLLVNAVINPLTALFDVPNGAVISNERIVMLAKKLTKEVAFVLQVNQREAWEQIKRVATNTAANTSSMRADILHNRETEVEAILGYLLNEVGREEQVPYILFMYEVILALQERGKN